jgi:dTDP-4-amino-4,6-dideoxygalactose transaminase
MPKAIVNVPYVDIAGQHASLKSELLEAIGRILDGGQFVLGPEVERFEEAFTEISSAKYALGLNSGTDALILGLKALGIGPGDEVITAPNSFIASAAAIAHVGAKPIFIDVRNDYNMNPDLIEGAVTKHTKAIMPVHLTGRPADMDPIIDVAERRGLFIVEDAAQAVLASYRDRKVGSFGEFGCFSLHPLKTLNACGDGGVITTNDSRLFDKIQLLRNHGLKTRDACDVWGFNSRLDSFQAAILLVKLKYLEEWTELRRDNAKIYQTELVDIPGISVPHDKDHERAVYHTFVIQAERRDELKQFLIQRGIGTSIHYPIPIHLQKAAEYLGWREGSFPIAEQQAKRILSLPVYPGLTRGQLEYVADAIRQFYKA